MDINSPACKKRTKLHTDQKKTNNSLAYKILHKFSHACNSQSSKFTGVFIYVHQLNHFQILKVLKYFKKYPNLTKPKFNINNNKIYYL